LVDLASFITTGLWSLFTVIFILRYSYHRSHHFPEPGDHAQEGAEKRQPADAPGVFKAGVEQVVQAQTEEEADHRGDPQRHAAGAGLQTGAQPARARSSSPVFRTHRAN